jgi:hypothetical protein
MYLKLEIRVLCGPLDTYFQFYIEY